MGKKARLIKMVRGGIYAPIHLAYHKYDGSSEIAAGGFPSTSIMGGLSVKALGAIAPPSF